MKCTLLLLCVNVFALIGLTLLEPFPVQVFLILIAVTLFFFLLAIAMPKERLWQKFLTYINLSLFSLFLVVSAFELYYYLALGNFRRNIDVSATNQDTDNAKQNIIEKGYTRKKAKSVLQDSGKVIYDVVYTYDAKHNRITPQNPQAKIAVVMVGCSFTFGDGLNDRDTVSWQLAEMLGKKYQVFNFGKSGYGVHHVLADLPKQLPSLQKYEKVLVFYTAIEDHQRRLTYGPKFIFENGTFVQKENYNSSQSNNPLIKFFYRLLDQSYFYRKIRTKFLDTFFFEMSRPKRIELMRKLIVFLEKYVHDKLPNAQFTLLAYPAYPEGIAEIVKGLPVKTIDVKSWLPNYEQEKEKPGSKYIIYPSVDMHPTAYANKIVATELAKIIVDNINK